MRVQELLSTTRKRAGKRLRRAWPKTMDVLQSRVERIRDSDTVASARKVIRRGGERSMAWVRDNPAVLPAVGLGGALAMWILRARRRAKQSRLSKLQKVVGSLPQVRKNFGFALGRILAWALSPRKPHVFRAVMIKW